MEWSSEQEAIFHAFRTSQTNLKVDAAPGSGKTTTSIELWNMAKESRTLSLAFNKNIVEEMLARVGQTRQELAAQGKAICTFNSLGAQIVNRSFKTKLNTNKIYKYIRNLEYVFPQRKKEEYSYNLAKVIQSCKSNILPDEYTSESIGALIDYFDLDTYEDIIDHTRMILKESAENTKEIDFADQLLFPILYDLPFPFYDVCLVDEAQDVNQIQRELLRHLQEANPYLRFVFVGDSHQAIYAFRGALADSLKVLGEEFDCLSLPLTLTRRCAKAIVSQAQVLWAESIQAPPDALEGLVRPCTDYETIDRRMKPIERDYTDVIPQETFSASDMVLCRTTAPLIRFAYQLLKCHIPCQVRGREIGEGFIRYIEKSQCSTVLDFLTYLEEDTDRQIAQKRVKPYADIQHITDRYDTLCIFAEQCSSHYVSDMIQHIKNLFEHGKGVLLSTVHKAKGLEAVKVYILAKDLMPHPLAVQFWAKEQEANIEYVAVTRAKEELVYL